MSAPTVHVTKYKDRKNLILWYTDPITEKRITKSARTTKWREAERAAAAWEADLATNRHTDDRLTWAGFCERIESEKLPGLAHRTATSYRTVLNSIEKHLDPKRFAVLVQPGVIGKYVKTLRAQKHPKPLSENTIASYLRHLRELLSWAKEAGLISAIPPLPKIRTGRRNAAMRGRPVTGEEFDRLIAATEAHRPNDFEDWKKYLRALWWSGLRLSESMRVSWDQDADFCVDLSGARPCFRIYAEGQKSRRDQLHPMAPEFAEFLEANWPPETRHGPLFTLRHAVTNRILTEAYDVSKAVASIGEAAGIIVSTNPLEHASAHDLRRSFGLRWASRVRAHVLKEMMRHKSIETTMQFYVRQDANTLADEIWNSLPSTEPSTLQQKQPAAGNSATG